MSAENVDYIRNTINDVSPDDRKGYMRALKDILIVSGDVPVQGDYIEAPLIDLVSMIVKAKKLPVINMNKLS